MSTNAHFSAKAATWDEQPRRREVAAAIAAGIRCHLPLAPHQQLLDVGCGTGLVSLALADSVATVHGHDSAQGMVDVFNQKAAATGCHAHAECRDLERDPLPEACCDLLITAMTCHHIADLEAALAAFVRALRPGGHLAIADLEPEDGSFHDASEPVPHHGLDPVWLLQRLQAHGMHGEWRRVHVIAKPGGDYPVFLLTATKPAPAIPPVCGRNPGHAAGS